MKSTAKSKLATEPSGKTGCPSVPGGSAIDLKSSTNRAASTSGVLKFSSDASFASRSLCAATWSANSCRRSNSPHHSHGRRSGGRELDADTSSLWNLCAAAWSAKVSKGTIMPHASHGTFGGSVSALGTSLASRPLCAAAWSANSCRRRNSPHHSHGRRSGGRERDADASSRWNLCAAAWSA
eukprot:CAMPEP_0204161924 /NCGR_PEP_ID=MMETSP0361-20130328/35132_1 /ASSEMBLY_ACC=CAM_ASM_000343 /TAXON_ID=268821 /ORGANISM="Scrippsiella Hangoei, Strain SHTV-5" /LENGTH=181 /DNA_ID=CAMNT_0051118437 /DNA_START=620 /DNA_END=1161 /DNA_ORIENTATION=+